MTKWPWVQILPGAGLFSLLYPISSVSLITHRVATLLIFLLKICLAEQLVTKQAQYVEIELNAFGSGSLM